MKNWKMKTLQVFLLGLSLLIVSSRAQVVDEKVVELSDGERFHVGELREGRIIFVVAKETVEKWRGYQPILYVWVDAFECPEGGRAEEHYVELTSLDSDTYVKVGCGENSGEQNAFNASLDNKGWEEVQVDAVGYTGQVHAELRISKKIILNDVVDEVNLNVQKEVEYWIEMDDEVQDAFLTLGITRMDLPPESLLIVGYVNAEGKFMEVEHWERRTGGKTWGFSGTNSFGPIRMRVSGDVGYLEVGLNLHKPALSAGICPEGFEKCWESVYQNCPSIQNLTFCIPPTRVCDGRLNCPGKCPDWERNETGLMSTFVYEEDACRCAEERSYCGYGYCSSEWVVTWGFGHIWWSMTVFVVIIMMSCCVFAITIPMRRRRRAAMSRQRVQQRIQNTSDQVDPFKLSPPPSYEEVVVEPPNRH